MICKISATFSSWKVWNNVLNREQQRNPRPGGMNVHDILEAFWCATKEVVQKLDSTETVEGHEVYYVGNG